MNLTKNDLIEMHVKEAILIRNYNLAQTIEALKDRYTEQEISTHYFEVHRRLGE